LAFLSEDTPGSVDKPEGVELTEALAAWLTQSVPGFEGPGRLTKFAFGQSNPTYRLTVASGDYVLRRKPLGPLLPKAHMIEREFRVLQALEGSDVPVPKVFAYCEDTSILGAAFYVMRFVEGRIFYDQRLPGVSAEERLRIFDAMNDAVARLHRRSPADLGLADFGRSQGFVKRQIELWTRQYRASEGSTIQAMERLIEWLPRNLPAEQPGRIFHGDLRLDNMIFHPTEPRVVALLDWELSTLGDPIADFAYHTMVWRIPPDLFRGFAGLDFEALGIPTETQYLERYCARVGLSELPNWHFYLAFSLFRVAAIIQGVWRRAQDGQASSADAMTVGAKAAPLAAIGWNIAQGGS
jgi:aminoglycoside phosphotransferase (APT) family kinase protein